MHVWQTFVFFINYWHKAPVSVNLNWSFVKMNLNTLPKIRKLDDCEYHEELSLFWLLWSWCQKTVWIIHKRLNWCEDDTVNDIVVKNMTKPILALKRSIMMVMKNFKKWWEKSNEKNPLEMRELLLPVL